MRDKLRISDIQVSTENGFRKLSSKVDGDYIFFRVPEDFELFPIAECFVGISLLEAMVSNRNIFVDGTPISRTLYDRLPEIQAIYSCWNSDLNIIEIQSSIYSETPTYKNIGSFFSAGVDGTHTLLRNMEDITHLIMFRAFDSGHDLESWTKRIKKQTRFAQSINKTLIPVETNALKWARSRKISPEFTHGLFLSSVGGALGMRRIYVASSHTYDELFPWGTHPLSDPMWSTESTEIIHDGAGSRRVEKMAEILKNHLLADNLQVCWRNTLRNCGECPKCIRTMVAVHLLGGKVQSLPKLSDLKNLKMLRPNDESGATYLEDTMILAMESGNKKIYKILKSYYRKYQISQLWPLIDKFFLGGFIRTLYRKIKKPDWLSWRVTLRGSNRWNI